MKSPKGPYILVIHATWCGHCKVLMPKFENEIVTSDNFNKELEGLLTLGSIEETEYNNHPEKNIFGKIDGYPTIRYIHFSENGKPKKSFDLPENMPREPEKIISWINGPVKDAIKDNATATANRHTKSKKQEIMNGGRKKKKYTRKRMLKKIRHLARKDKK